MKRIASVWLVVLLLICGAESALADTAAATTMKLEATTGTVTVKNASGVAQTVRDGMRLYNGYTLSTAAASEAYISLDSSKAVKLGASGKVQIKQAGKQLEVSVSAGELFFNVTAPLKTDESLNVRTSTMVTGVRGSFGWVKPGETGLMHGSVILTHPGGGVAATLSSGQLARADGKPAAITAADVPTLVAREMRDNPALLEQVRQDVPSVDVGELMDNLDARIAQEREAEQAAQTALEARQAAETGASTKPNSGSTSRNRGNGSSGIGIGNSGGSNSGGGGNVVTFYTVTYRDAAGGSVFADEAHGGLAYGAATPPYSGGEPVRAGYTFAGWSPSVAPFVNGNAVYTAQWQEVPDVPDTPDTPDKPDVPDTPDTPDKPDVPDTPDTPDKPDVPDTPDTPDKPDVPDTPDTPDKPDVPDTPDTPDKPDVPDTPDTPDKPDVPDTPDTPDKPDVPDTPDTPDKPDVPDTPDTPDKPEYTVTFRVPEGALLTVFYDLTQDGLLEVYGTQEVELPREAEVYLYLSRPESENNDRVSLPFRVLVDGKEWNDAFLRVTRDMTLEVVETQEAPSDTQLLRRLSVTVAVPASLRDSYGDTFSMSFAPDEHNVIVLPAFLSRLSRFEEWETKILPRKVTVSMELAEGATAFPAAQSLATVRDCYDLAHRGFVVVKDSLSSFYVFRFRGEFDDGVPFLWR